MWFKLCLKLSLVCLFLACSRPGSEDATNPAPKAAKKKKKAAASEETTNYESGVGLSLIQQSGLSVDRCPYYEREPKMEIIPEGTFVFDGLIDDWKARPVTAYDASGDATSNDIIWSKMAYEHEGKEAIIGAVQLRHFNYSAGDALILEFGSLTTQENLSVHMVSSRSYLLSAAGVSELVNDEWRPVDARVLSLKVDEVKASLEWRIEKRQLDSVLSKALWWTRLKTVQAENMNTIDYTGLSYFRSEDPVLQNEYNLTLCRADSFDQVPFRFFQIAKKSISSSDVELIFDHVRSVYDGTEQQLGYRAMGVQSIATLVATDPIVMDLDASRVTDDPLLEYLYPVVFDAALATSIDQKDLSNFYRRTLSAFTRMFLKQGRQTTRGYLEVFATFFEAEVIRHRTGLSSWLAFLGHRTNQYLKVDEGLTPDGLINRYERLGEGIADPIERERYTEETINKTFALVHVLTRYIGSAPLAHAWYDRARSLKDALGVAVSSPALIATLWPGWLDAEPFSTGFEPGIMSDKDFDGLPAYLETELGTASTASDSDEDGWSDLAELTMKYDPLSRLSVPKALLADGLFGDWQELLPTKIHINKSKVANSKCPRSTYINAYAALLTKDGVLVSLKMRSPAPENGKTGWEIAFDGLDGAKDIFFRAVSGRFGYDVVNAKGYSLLTSQPAPIRNSGEAVEWFFPAHSLWTEPPGAKPVSVRVTTTLEGKNRESCDMTPWFRTLYK